MTAPRTALCRWWSATDRVRRALPAGARLDTWQLDAYSDEPYCENFRGVKVERLHLRLLRRRCDHTPAHDGHAQDLGPQRMVCECEGP